MNNNPLNKGVIAENFAGVGTVTGRMVSNRARELARIEGHSGSLANQTDYEQAKRELTGGDDISPQEAELDALPDMNSAPVSGGSQSPVSASEDEDDEGRNESEQLVAEGVNEAEHDQMLQSARAE